MVLEVDKNEDLEGYFRYYLKIFSYLEDQVFDKENLKEIKFEEKFTTLIFLENLISALLVDLIKHRNFYIKEAFKRNKDFKDIHEKIKYDYSKIDYTKNKSLEKLTLGDLKNVLQNSFSTNYLNKFNNLLNNLGDFIKKRNYIHHRILTFPSRYLKEQVKSIFEDPIKDLENKLEETIKIGKKIYKTLKNIDKDLRKYEVKINR